METRELSPIIPHKNIKHRRKGNMDRKKKYKKTLLSISCNTKYVFMTTCRSV